MKKLKIYLFVLSLIAIFWLMQSGCSSRIETSVTENDSTIVYPSKKSNGVTARVTLYRKVDKGTGELFGAGTVFSTMDNANLRAFVELDNLNNSDYNDLMFHFDWIDPSGKSFYIKRVDLSPDDSVSTIKSSISVSPEQREPGEYMLRIYFFRELIAEKRFEFLPQLEIDPDNESGISANITLYRKKSKKSGRLIGKGNSFAIKKKGKVRALIELENRFFYGQQELILNIDWMRADGKSIFSKHINLYPGDSATTFKSSISISPGKHEQGEYLLRISLFDKVITEQKFELQ